MPNPSSRRAKKLRLSIPIKVVLITGFAYLFIWLCSALLMGSGLLDAAERRLGLDMSILMTMLQVIAVALAATAGTHFFIDRPLVRLTKVMSKAEEGDFLVRAPISSNDELGELASTFNRMLGRITDLTANQLQADHDLMMVSEQLKYRTHIEEKNSIIQQTNQTLEHLVRDLSLIYDIGQEVGSISDLDDLYARITATLTRRLKIHEFAILIFDEKKEELQVKAAYGFADKDAVLRVRFKMGEGITGLVAQTGKKIYIRNTTNEARFLNYKCEKPPEASSFLSVPLSYKSEVMGVINFARRGVRSFSFQDVKMLSLVAGQVATAIANARLYTKTRELSVRDELTGLNNRRYFQQMLQMEWKRAVRFKRTLSLIMIDVDHFKKYNDSYGHLQGDRVLREIGSLLKKNLREVDTVARFGGEEFILLLPDTDKHGAAAVAEKIRALVESTRFIADDRSGSRGITISSGVAAYPDDVSEMDDLIDHADIALYTAKENGRNRTESYPSQPAGKEEEGFTTLVDIKSAQGKKPEFIQ